MSQMNEAIIRTRHLKYFAQLAEQAEAALRSSQQATWHTRLYDERDNIRAGLEWANKTNVEAGLYLSSRLYRFWEGFDLQEGIHWLDRFLQNPESNAYPHAKAKALLGHGRILGRLQQYTQAYTAAQACLELFRANGDLQGEIDGLLLLGYMRWTTDEKDVELHQQALALAQSIDDIWRQASALYQLGWNYSDDKRLTYWGQAIMLFRQSGDWGQLVSLLSMFGQFAMLNGDSELAQQSLDEAIQLSEQLKDKRAKSDLLYARARMAIMQAEYSLAHIYLQEVLEIEEEFGARMDLLWCQALLGYLALLEGNLTKARDTFTETARNFQKDQNVVGVVFSLEGIATLSATSNKSDDAARLIGWADSTRQKISDKRPRLEQVDVDKIIAACISKIGEVAFSNLYNKGQNMTLDEAVAYALGES